MLHFDYVWLREKERKEEFVALRLEKLLLRFYKNKVENNTRIFKVFINSIFIKKKKEKLRNRRFCVRFIKKIYFSLSLKLYIIA